MATTLRVGEPDVSTEPADMSRILGHQENVLVPSTQGMRNESLLR